jgi:glutathione peroxidase
MITGIFNMEKQTVFDFSATLLDGREESLAKFRGQVLLIVNTASKCGFTPQYAALESLYQTYWLRGFTILGFPSNQFGAQEPGSAAEIAAFCETRFGVTFPLFAKIDVNGPGAHPLYRFLRRHRPGIFGILGSGAIRWNFTKFLINRNGEVTERFGPARKPEKLAGAIERLLGEPAPELV